MTFNGQWPGSDLADPTGDNGTMTSAQYKAAMYDRPASNYAVAQRSLCKKCHAKD